MIAFVNFFSTCDVAVVLRNTEQGEYYSFKPVYLAISADLALPMGNFMVLLSLHLSLFVICFLYS